MDSPVLKGWAVKHPVLVRVFAIAVAILAVILLYSSYIGFDKAAEEHQDRIEYQEKLRGRIDNYIALTEEVENAISYDDAYAQLEEMVEKHEHDAAEHKTDTAMYSAELGGYTMGADLIYEVKPELERARYQMNITLELYNQQKGAIDNVIAASNAAASGGSASIGSLKTHIGTLSAIIAQKPTLEEPPTEPTEPEGRPAGPETMNPGEAPTAPPDPESLNPGAAPPDPGTRPEALPDPGAGPAEPTAPTEGDPDYDALMAKYDTDLAAYNDHQQLVSEFNARQQQIAAYDTALAAFNAYPGKIDDYEAALAAHPQKLAEYEAAKKYWDGKNTEYIDYKDNKYPALVAEFKASAAYTEYLAAKTAYQDALKKYNEETVPAYKSALAAWEGQCTSCRAGAAADFVGALMTINAQSGTLQSLGGQAASIASALGSGATSSAGGGSEAQMMAMMQAIQNMGYDTAAMSNDEFIANCGTLIGALTAIDSAIAAVGQGVASIGPTLTAANDQLTKAEWELKGQLENIWYHVSELEDDRGELLENKGVLDEEASTISKKILETDELRELENDQISAKLLLTGVKEINDMFAENDDLVLSAETYLEDYSKRTEELYKGSMLMCILGLIAGLFGLLAVPAAYDKPHNRILLILPVVLCLLLACAAEGISIYLAVDRNYPAIFMAVIALCHLLVVLPKEKVRI